GGEGGGSFKNETPPPTISASGRWRCRAVGCVARRAGASLSDAAGAHHCRLCRREDGAQTWSQAQLAAECRPDGRRRRPFGNPKHTRGLPCPKRSLSHPRPAPPRLMSSASKSRFLHQAPELVVTKSSARQARKAADLGRTIILGMSPSTW